MNSKYLPAALALGLTACAALADDAEHTLAVRPLTLDDYERIREPGPPQLSPDGERVVMSLDDQLYLVEKGSEPRALTSVGKASEPHWSADGGTLYFLSDRSGTSQVWALPFGQPGEARQLTSLDTGVPALNMAPDESRLLLVLADSDRRSGDAPETPQPIVVTRRGFREDAGTGYLTAEQYKHLYVLDLESGGLDALTSGNRDETDAAWSPDGAQVAFVSNREPVADADYRTDIWTIAATAEAGGDAEPRRLTDNARTKHSPAWSPDGDSVAYVSAEDGVYGQQRIAIVAAAGGEPRLLTASLDRWISSFEFSDDGKWIYFVYDDAGAALLARVRVRDAKIERLVEGPRTVSAFDVGASGRVVASMSDGNVPPDIYRLDRGEPERLTRVNDDVLRGIAVGEKRKVSFESTAGTMVESFITTPPGFEPGQRLPTILRVHGGPVGQFAWAWDFDTQYLAANGYAVVEPNPRGSTGHGQAFIRGIYRTWGITDYDDVIAAVDHAIEIGIADPERLGVTGYSYGGYMTNMVVTRTGRFKAAVSGAGHSLIIANYGHDIYQAWYNWELGVPWEHRERYDRLSPFLAVANIETPMLFLGGGDDWNVPVLNAQLMYQALKVRGIDTELVVYPGVHHGGWPAAYEKDYLERLVAWFDRYLKTGEAANGND